MIQAETLQIETLQILLVEDSEGDALLTRLAFETLESPHIITHVTSGAGALAFLMAKGEYQNRILPHLILLDLNLPAMSGDEVLLKIKAEESLMHIPVLVLSGSSSPRDIERAYSLFASGYIEKPSNSESFKAAAKAIEAFWFNTVSLVGG